jgi:pimeloyl-ACP methyl ester carboxylesterase
MGELFVPALLPTALCLSGVSSADRSVVQDPLDDGVPLMPVTQPAGGRPPPLVRAALAHRYRRDLAWAAALVRCPSLMIATDDRGEWTPAECAATAAAMTDARSAVITGPRGLPSLECPTELATVVTDFWAATGSDATDPTSVT